MKQEFLAEIKQHKNGAYIEPPFDVEGVFGGLFNEFRSEK